VAAKIQGFLFDLDGVIVFTDKYHYRAWAQLADEQGWAFDEEVNEGCRGVPRMSSLQVILDHNGIDLPQAEKERLANVKNNYYKELLTGINETDVYPGVVPFLKGLREQGLKMAVCSSSKNALPVLSALDLATLFDAVITGNDIICPKPDPEIFLKGAAALGLEPEECLVFEDAASGVEAAHAAGMPCIGIGPGERLAAAEMVISDYAGLDLPGLVAGRLKQSARDPFAGI